MYFYEIISSCIHFCRKKLWHMSREFIFADDGILVILLGFINAAAKYILHTFTAMHS